MTTLLDTCMSLYSCWTSRYVNHPPDLKVSNCFLPLPFTLACHLPTHHWPTYRSVRTLWTPKDLHPVAILLFICRALKSFRRCIVPLERSCKHGVSMVLNHQIDLHKYLLKMDFICKNQTLPGQKNTKHFNISSI